MPRIPAIGIVGYLAITPMAELVAGMEDWCVGHRPYRIYKVEHDSVRYRLQADEQIDAWLVAHASAATLLPDLQQSGAPLLLMDGSLAHDRLPLVRFDDEAVGKLAAQHLLPRSNGPFVFLGGHRWFEAARKHGFQTALKSAGASCTHITSDCEQQALSAAMARIPQHTTIFASTDELARRGIDALLEQGRELPRDALMLGVDNEPVYCEQQQPTLSSIRLPYREQGRHCMRLLDAMLHGQDCRGQVISVQPHELVERQSSNREGGALLVQAAIDGMRADPTLELDAIAKHLHCSRRSLERAFAKHLGCSPKDRQRIIRMELAAQLLQRNPEQSLTDLALSCGFNSVSTLRRTCRAHFGCAPADLRHSDPASPD